MGHDDVTLGLEHPPAKSVPRHTHQRGDQQHGERVIFYATENTQKITRSGGGV